jgi:endonuclease III
MEPVMEVLFQKWPTSSHLASANPADVEDVIKSLGMQKKRASTLISMSSQYSSGAWKDVRELKGVGEYAARAYEIFILGKLGSSPPKDHALLLYWNFLNNNHPELFVSGEAA